MTSWLKASDVAMETPPRCEVMKGKVPKSDKTIYTEQTNLSRPQQELWEGLQNDCKKVWSPCQSSVHSHVVSSVIFSHTLCCFFLVLNFSCFFFFFLNLKFYCLMLLEVIVVAFYGGANFFEVFTEFLDGN